MTRKINYTERVCECCGKVYKPTCATQKWCPNCGLEMKRKMKKQYAEEHKEEIKRRRLIYESNPEKKQHKLEYNRKRYQEKKEEINTKNKIYRETHREQKRERDRKYREAHREEIRAKQRQRRQENLEEYRKKDRERSANRSPEQKEALKQYKKQYKKQYYQSNKEDILKKQKSKRDANKEEYNRRSRDRYYANIEESRRKQRDYSKRPEVKERNNKRRRERRLNDAVFHLKERMRKFIGRCIHFNKSKHTFDILDYTPEQLRSHIEAQFTDAMNWDNYGDYWSIDHIKPLDAFNFYKEDGEVDYTVVAEANRLNNLRPVLISQNSIKGSIWTEQDEIEYQKKLYEETKTT